MSCSTVVDACGNILQLVGDAEQYSDLALLKPEVAHRLFANFIPEFFAQDKEFFLPSRSLRS